MIGKILGVTLLGFVTITHFYDAGKFGAGYEEPAKKGRKYALIHLLDGLITGLACFAWWFDW